MRARHRDIFLFCVLIFMSCVTALGMERFPPPEFESDYVFPEQTAPEARAPIWQVIDPLVLVAALGLSSYLVLRRRSRRAVFVLMLLSLAYFGFYRKGCICSIGSIQNVTLSLFDTGYAIPTSGLIFFFAPLVATLFFGRTFCAAVCPLGAVQDLTALWPIRLPRWLEHGLRYLAYVYLALAVLLAALGSTFIICRYDPYVAIFRRNANLNILILGGALLVMGLFVARPYCRFLCPYGVILRQLSRLSKWRVRITPTTCIQCKLCEESCPFGAIQTPVPEWPVDTYARDKKRLSRLLLLLPLLIAGGAWFGHVLAPVTSRTHPTVAVAQRIWLEETEALEDRTDASSAFRATGETVASLYERAESIKVQFGQGGWFFGGFLGLVLGGKLLLLSLRRRQTDFEAERAGCVSCARCIAYCPKEHERRAHIEG
ncbi:4Fe-4S binding protein, partial [Planctomycetota bacterium]